MYASAKIAYEWSLFCIFGCSISMLSNNAVRKEPWIPIVRRKVRMQKSKKFLVKASPMPDKASKDNEKIKAFRLPKISAISPKKNIHKWKQMKTEKPFLEFRVLRWFFLSNSLIYLCQFGAKIIVKSLCGTISLYLSGLLTRKILLLRFELLHEKSPAL